MINNITEIAQWLSKYSDKIEYVKVTRFENVSFNEMEGNNYNYNLKIVTVDGYKNKLWKDNSTNSSYFDWYGLDESKEGLQEYFDNALI